jgi:hypothetical protein
MAVVSKVFLRFFATLRLGGSPVRFSKDISRQDARLRRDIGGAAQLCLDL